MAIHYVYMFSVTLARINPKYHLREGFTRDSTRLASRPAQSASASRVSHAVQNVCTPRFLCEPPRSVIQYNQYLYMC